MDLLDMKKMTDDEKKDLAFQVLLDAGYYPASKAFGDSAPLIEDTNNINTVLITDKIRRDFTEQHLDTLIALNELRVSNIWNSIIIVISLALAFAFAAHWF